MQKKVNYKCKDNDVRLQFHLEDNMIDEVWVQIQGESSWTIVGYEDLMQGIEKATQGKNILNKILELSNLERCQSAEDMQHALEEINDLVK